METLADWAPLIITIGSGWALLEMLLIFGLSRHFRRMREMNEAEKEFDSIDAATGDTRR